MTGTAIAQAIPIALLPLLTRLYSPEDFGLLALYTSVASIFGVIAAAKYEQAIMLPHEDEDAKTVLWLCGLLVGSISFLLMLIVCFWSKEISIILGNRDIESWLYIVPLSVLLSGVYQSFIYWNNRRKRYSDTAYSRVLQSGSQVGSQVLIAMTGVSGGLIFGQVVGAFFSVQYLLYKNKEIGREFVEIKKEKIIESARRYIIFPKFGVFGALCDVTGVQMPILMLTKYFSSATVGFFSLTFKVLNLPTSLVSSALAQVFFQKIVEINNGDKPEELKRFVIKSVLILVLIFLPVVPFFWLFSEDIFVSFFGEKWRGAGEYAKYMVFAVAIRFCVSPLSSVMTLNENIKKGTLWQGLYLVTITITLFCFSDSSIENFLIAFVIHDIALYGLYLVFILSSCPKARLSKA